MSTAELELNAWVQTQSTVDGLEAWWRLTEAHLDATTQPKPEPEAPKTASEQTPGLQDDFWQEWFGFWT